MIILRNKTFSLLIPFKNTFKYINRAGNSLVHGKVKEAGKNTLKATGNLAEGSGKLILGVSGGGLLGTSIISNQFNNMLNDRSSFITTYN